MCLPVCFLLSPNPWHLLPGGYPLPPPPKDPTLEELASEENRRPLSEEEKLEQTKR